HADGYRALQTYYQTYAALAQAYRVGLVLESATWRANPDWGEAIGYSPAALAEANRQAIALLHDIRRVYETDDSPMAISGCIGPRGDGYVPAKAMSAEQARRYHRPQIDALRDAEADFVSAVTMNDVEEAIGITLAAKDAEMPVVISFTVETDGKLPAGEALSEAIAQVDDATEGYPAYYMLNCAHPTHFADVLVEGDPWLGRIRGVRANASTKSHAELDEVATLDDGNPAQLGSQYRELKAKLEQLNILGGCCGTDERHVEAMCKACLPLFWTHASTVGQWSSTTRAAARR
ncbi:MAG: homocysteine S-methyltransferase family protein, partial [Cyanobacteria bacterium J06639_1]